MKRTFCIAMLFMAAPVLAQSSDPRSGYPAYKPSAAVKNGYSAEDLRDAEVRGVNGEKIGEIDDLIIGPDGQLRRLIVSVNQGWFGTGGRQLAVQWNDVKPGPKTAKEDYEVQYVTVPVTKNNVEEFGLFKDKPKAINGHAREWRASELIGDSINLKDVGNYGTVADLLFDAKGHLKVIAGSSDIGGSGPPFFSMYSGDDAGWDPGDDYYTVPYSTAEIAKVLPEDQNRKRDSIN